MPRGRGYGRALRLPLAVRPVFIDWLERSQPLKADKVQSLIRATRGGKLSSSQFGTRMRGEGLMAEQIKQTFKVFAKRHGLDGAKAPLETRNFRPPLPASGQRRLF